MKDFKQEILSRWDDMPDEMLEVVENARGIMKYSNGDDVVYFARELGRYLILDIVNGDYSTAQEVTNTMDYQTGVYVDWFETSEAYADNLMEIERRIA